MICSMSVLLLNFQSILCIKPALCLLLTGLARLVCSAACYVWTLHTLDQYV